MYEQIAANKRKTVLIVVGALLFTAGIGFLIGLIIGGTFAAALGSSAPLAQHPRPFSLHLCKASAVLAVGERGRCRARATLRAGSGENREIH